MKTMKIFAMFQSIERNSFAIFFSKLNVQTSLSFTSKRSDRTRMSVRAKNEIQDRKTSTFKTADSSKDFAIEDKQVRIEAEASEIEKDR